MQQVGANEGGLGNTFVIQKFIVYAPPQLFPLQKIENI